MQIIEKSADILIIGGGAAGCFAAITLAESHPELQVLLLEKAGLKRSGCLAAGVNALNAYITPGHVPQDYVNYAAKDAAGLDHHNQPGEMSEERSAGTQEKE